jgi:hypothetical protein
MGTDHVGVDERGGPKDRAIHVRLGREVHDGIDAFLGQQATNQLRVADIAVHETKVVSSIEWTEARPVTRIGQRIEHDQAIVRMRLSPVENKIGADEAGAARDK